MNKEIINKGLNIEYLKTLKIEDINKIYNELKGGFKEKWNN